MVSAILIPAVRTSNPVAHMSKDC